MGIKEEGKRDIEALAYNHKPNSTRFLCPIPQPLVVGTRFAVVDSSNARLGQNFAPVGDGI